ncbi:MAG: late competence development ComFB family protein [Oscillospiraceae bacterium]|nr:late competence development ComFB family protein [Oscillospiraceae bacterium]
MASLKNHMEDVVFTQMDSILSDMNMCTCEKCKLDIAAIALNNLPPKYVVTERGVLFSKLETLQQQYEISITAAIIRAALLVKKTPWHELQEGY